MARPLPVLRSRWSRLLALVLLLVLVAVVLSVRRNESIRDAPHGRLTVSAAASLTDAFGAMRQAFETRYEHARVTVNASASSTLAAQILAGAPVDVFASADQATMTKVVDAGLVRGEPTVFATNSLRIIVRRGNPQGITSLADLARSGIVYVTCSTDVPIGKYAAQVLQRAGVTVTPRSFEPDVRGIVTKVVSGEADAGIVYATDVAATNGAASGVDIPSSSNLTATYPIAALSDAGDATTATAWIDFVLSDSGRAILESFGFGVP